MRKVVNIIREELNGLNEREDLQQIKDVNSVFREIEAAIHAGKYEKTGEISASIKIPRNGHELSVIFFRDKPANKGEAVFTIVKVQGRDKPVIKIYGVRLNDKDFVFDEQALGHELRHYLDWVKGNDLGGQNIDQFNHPSEYNAYMIMYLSEYIERIDGLYGVPENWNEFVNGLDEYTEIFDYRTLLTPEMQKKFDNRLYAFHQKLLETKNLEPQY